MKPSIRHIVAVVTVFLLVSAGGATAAGQIIAALKKLTFDTATHRFSLSWELAADSIPTDCEGAFSVLCGAAPLPAQPDNSFPITSLTGNTAFSVEQLRFDTVYRAGMWLRIQGVWYPPDSSLFRTVAVPAAVWEPVRLFSAPVGDTVAVLAKQVLIWRDASYGSSSPPHADTVRRYDPPVSRLKSFVSAASGFTFTDPVSLPPFFIGFRLDSLLKKAPGCAIYRDSSGHLLVEHQSVRDTVGGIIYVKTSRTDLPFIVLADTLAPRVAFNVDTGSVIGPDSLRMMFTIRDNSSNCQWRLFYGGADERPFSAAAQFSGTLSDTTAKISCQIPVTGTGEAGLRIHLTTSDGAHADTINISRRSARVRCNETTTPADMILPLAPGAALNHAGCADALHPLFERSGGSYATDRFRLYAWQPSASTGGWAEYSPGDNAAFTFLPGKLYWLITRDAMPLDFGDGRSVSLKDTLAIDLPPNAWTDFSSPYSFPVAFKDIIAASDEQASRISCYQWRKDVPLRTWRAEPVYNRAIPGLDDPSTLLPYGTNGYFTVYNPSDSPVSLRIPPVPPSKKTAKTTPLGETTSGWTIRFDLERNGAACGSVLCAASPAVATTGTVPASPAFYESSITVAVSGNGGKNGIVVFPLGGRTAPEFEITVANAHAEKADFVIVPRRIAGSPSGIIVTESIKRDILQRIPLTIDAQQSKRIVFRAGKDAGGARSAPFVTSPPRILSAASRSGGIVLRINSIAPVNDIELFDPIGRKRGAISYGPLNGNAITAGARPNSTSGVVIVRLTTQNERGTRERHLTTAVQVR